MHHLTGILGSEKCVIRQFCHCGNIIRVHWHRARWYSLLHTQVMWHSLLLLDYKPVQCTVQHATKSSRRENDTVQRRCKHQMYVAAASITQHGVLQKRVFRISRKNTLK